MSFLDLFRPKWKHSDGYVRVAAIRQLTDRRILRKIAVEDDDWAVYLAAMETLGDDDTVRQIALSAEFGPQKRMVAIGEIDDQSVLEHIARNCPDADLREAAVGRLHEPQDLIAHLARDDPEAGIRRAAARQLRDQDLLASIAETDPNGSVRSSAVGGMDVEGALVSIATHDPSPVVRKRAVERISDDEALAGIVRGEPEPEVRVAARERIGSKRLRSKLRPQPDPQRTDAWTAELIAVGGRQSFVSGEPGGGYNSSRRHEVAVRIGWLLHEAGGFRLMQTVGMRVRSSLGPLRGRELEVAWGGIGEWQA